MVFPFPVCRQVYAHKSRPPSVERSRPSGDQIRPTEFFAPNPVPISVHSSASVLGSSVVWDKVVFCPKVPLSSCLAVEHGMKHLRLVLPEWRQTHRRGRETGPKVDCGQIVDCHTPLESSLCQLWEYHKIVVVRPPVHDLIPPTVPVAGVACGSGQLSVGVSVWQLPVLTTEDTPFGRRLLYRRCGLALLGVVSGRRFDW